MFRLHSDSATQDRDLWCKAFTEADFPKCKTIALAMLAEGSERLFALKSLAQALHYLGDHADARSVAEEVRANARTFLEASAVHPFVSMSIVLARIAFLELRPDEASGLAADALAHARRDNAVSVCQALAMACIPVAVWRGDADAAHRYARILLRTSEVEQLGYWRIWGLSMLHSVALHFDLAVPGPEVDLDSLDALQSDHLVMLDARTVSDLAIARVSEGLVGWTAPEVLRLQASTMAWYDQGRATALLREARSTAERQGARAWVARIDQTVLAAGNSPKRLEP